MPWNRWNSSQHTQTLDTEECESKGESSQFLPGDGNYPGWLVDHSTDSNIQDKNKDCDWNLSTNQPYLHCWQSAKELNPWYNYRAVKNAATHPHFSLQNLNAYKRITYSTNEVDLGSLDISLYFDVVNESDTLGNVTLVSTVVAAESVLLRGSIKRLTKWRQSPTSYVCSQCGEKRWNKGLITRHPCVDDDW